VEKLLAKYAAERYQHADEVAVDLRRLMRERESGRAAAPSVAEPVRIPSLAVLPFANLSADRENEYFSDGLAEDIIDALTQEPGLLIMARTSAFAFRGKQQDIRKIGAELNVEHLLEGSVRRAGNRLRVTAQLVKASDGYHLWSQHFDREMTDVFAIQDEISQAIAGTLRLRLTGDRPLVKPHTDNMDAYHLFLRGRHCVFRGTPESLAKGKEYLDQAIALDPEYAAAHAGIAEYYLWSGFLGFKEPKKALTGSKSAALEALSRDDTLAEAHSALGVVLAAEDFDWPRAERELNRALELAPASPFVRFFLGMFFLRATGRLADAVSHLQQAVELDPLSAVWNGALVYLHYARGEYGQAVAQHRRVKDLDPSEWLSDTVLVNLHLGAGRMDEAIRLAQRACDLSTRNALAVGNLGSAYGLAGRRDDACVLLNELTASSRTTYVPPSAMMIVYFGLGELDRALEWLERSVEERDMVVICSVKSEPGYIPLHGHPRYQALLRKMNLEP
jgi:serine/threonine-protein kinase